MAKLTELVRDHTQLDREQVAHLSRLVSEWGMLADFCFSDLLLYVPTSSGRWAVVAQVRPATGQTMYQTDWVGSWANDSEVDLIERAYRDAKILEGEIVVEGLADETRMVAIPVVHSGRPIAVLTREWIEKAGRRPGELERAYDSIFQSFIRMIAMGTFPFTQRAGDSSAAPRVGDGVMWFDVDGEVQYVSPNANSALHRVGIQASAIGMRLAELGFHDGPVRQAFERKVPVIEEFEQGDGVTLLCRCVPFVELTNGDEHVIGAVLLMRDVSELRKRDRLLLSKDATIREIHHRVKNNLQTISSLLRLAEEGLQSVDRPVRFTVHGDGGRIPAAIATPLSVVLTELLQNAVDHGFPEGSAGGSVVVQLENADRQLRLSVVDDGRGVESGFRLEDATGLGLSIVRTLVTTELDGRIEMRPLSEADARSVGLETPAGARGTVVDLIVPLGEE